MNPLQQNNGPWPEERTERSDYVSTEEKHIFSSRFHSLVDFFSLLQFPLSKRQAGIQYQKRFISSAAGTDSVNKSEWNVGCSCSPPQHVGIMPLHRFFCCIDIPFVTSLQHQLWNNQWVFPPSTPESSETRHSGLLAVLYRVIQKSSFYPLLKMITFIQNVPQIVFHIPLGWSSISSIFLLC